MLDQLKSFFRDTIALPPDLVLVIVGLIAHLLLCLVLRKPLNSAWGLLAPIIIGIFIEGYEIWVQYRDVGLFAPSNDPLAVILLRHSLDILKMLVLPVLLVAIGKISAHPAA
jgi:hypothetical protein